jgi:cell division protein FtsN
MLRLLKLAIVFVLIPATAAAQGNAVVNPAYRRAQTLVNDGNAAAGRALVDSMINAAAPGSNDYAEGVYWRAVLAATALDAEMDYRRILVDYPQSPRVEDALVRLAQLEIARANYDAAVRHLNTLITDHPQSPSRARAGYWLARALFDKNDVQGGCAATTDALGRTSEDDAELRNQILYLNQRCAGVAVATAPVATAPAAVIPPPASVPAVTPAAPSIDSTAKVITSKPVVTTPVTTAPSSPPMLPPAVTKPRPKPVEAPPVEKTPPVETVAPSRPAASGNWSVQIAAYNVKSQAVAMVAKLKQRGYEARVDGEKAPFRVRIGRYATSAQASAVQRSLKAKQITGFVVQANTQ